MEAVTSLRNNNKTTQKYEISALVGSITAIVASTVLIKQNNQEQYPSGLNGEDIFTPAERCIEDMSVAAVIKKKKKTSQKYDGGDLSGGIVLMAVDMAPEKLINKTESIIKINEWESVPPDGDIDEMEAAVALKKHNTHSEKYKKISTMDITAMVDSTLLKTIQSI